MLRTSISPKIALGVTIFTALCILSGCTQDTTTNNTTTDKTSSSNEAEGTDQPIAGKPYLSMNIEDYPATISNKCQDVVFKLSVTNDGDTTLAYKDFTDTYFLKIVSDDAKSATNNTSTIGDIDATNFDDDEGLITYKTMLDDFGTLEPGESKTLTFRSKNYIIEDQHDYFWINSFSDIANGNYTYYFVFGELPQNGSSLLSGTIISRSSSITITTDTMDSNGGGRFCDYTTIQDPSIDFWD